MYNQVKEIDAQRVDGKFVDANGQVAQGSDEVSALLQRCLRWSELSLERLAGTPNLLRNGPWPTYLHRRLHNRDGLNAMVPCARR